MYPSIICITQITFKKINNALAMHIIFGGLPSLSLRSCLNFLVTKSSRSVEPIGNLRFDDGNVNDNATNQLFDWLNEDNRAARAARFLVQWFDVVCQTTT